jgi:transcriptional regulator with XRE-family HTH domain
MAEAGRRVAANQEEKAELERAMAQARAALGVRIRQARDMAGFRSAASLAEILGISTQQVQKYETGKDWPNPFMLVKIAEALRRSVTWFLGLIEAGPEELEAPDAAADALCRLLRHLPEKLRLDVYSGAAAILVGRIRAEDTQAASLFERLFHQVLKQERRGFQSYLLMRGGAKGILRSVVATVLVAYGTLAGPSLAVAGPVITERELLRERDQVCGPDFFMGYTAGAADAVVSLMDRPEGMELGRVARETEREIREHPEHNHSSGFTAVLRALRRLGVLDQRQIDRFMGALPRE